MGKQELPYAAVAAELGLSESALRVRVHRLRKRFREVFREEIGHTVTNAEDADEELRHRWPRSAHEPGARNGWPAAP